MHLLFCIYSYLCLSLQFHTCQLHISSNLIRSEWGSHQQSDMQCRDLGCSHSVRHTPITHLHSQVIHLGIARIFHDLCFEVVGEGRTELRTELRTKPVEPRCPGRHCQQVDIAPGNGRESGAHWQLVEQRHLRSAEAKAQSLA